MCIPDEGEVEVERLENWDSDAAAHRLFQHIYSQASEEKQKVSLVQ